MKCINCNAAMKSYTRSAMFEENKEKKAYVACNKCSNVMVGTFDEDESLKGLVKTFSSFGEKTKDQMKHAVEMFKEARVPVKEFGIVEGSKIALNDMDKNLLAESAKFVIKDLFRRA